MGRCAEILTKMAEDSPLRDTLLGAGVGGVGGAGLGYLLGGGRGAAYGGLGGAGVGAGIGYGHRHLRDFIDDLDIEEAAEAAGLPSPPRGSESAEEGGSGTGVINPLTVGGVAGVGAGLGADRVGRRQAREGDEFMRDQLVASERHHAEATAETGRAAEVLRKLDQPDDRFGGKTPREFADQLSPKRQGKKTPHQNKVNQAKRVVRNAPATSDAHRAAARQQQISSDNAMRGARMGEAQMLRGRNISRSGRGVAALSSLPALLGLYQALRD